MADCLALSPYTWRRNLIFFVPGKEISMNVANPRPRSEFPTCITPALQVYPVYNTVIRFTTSFPGLSSLPPLVGQGRQRRETWERSCETCFITKSAHIRQ